MWSLFWSLIAIGVFLGIIVAITLYLIGWIAQKVFDRSDSL